MQAGSPFSSTGNAIPSGGTGAFFGNQFVPGTVAPFGFASGATGFAPGSVGADFYTVPNAGFPQFDTSGLGQTNVVGFTTNTTPAVPAAFSGSSNSAAAMDTSTASVARLRLLVPADAVVWVDGQRTAPTGFLREYVSPRIDPNREYGYDVRAEWNENGQPVTRSRKITFFAGDRLTINLLDTGSDRRDPVIHQTLKRSEPGNPAMTLTPPPYASFEVATDEGARDGIVTRVTPTGVVVKGQDERVFEYDLAQGAQITCDNSACPLSAIKPGMRARVMTKNNNLHTALRVEALDRNLDFVKPTR
jgi:uncharacterized protein (TIGR03000 family)